MKRRKLVQRLTLLILVTMVLALGAPMAPAAHAAGSVPAGCTVVGWGYNDFGIATSPAGLTDVVAIAAGYTHSLALKSNGTVVGWGDGFGIADITPPADLANVMAIAAGLLHGVALKADGTVVAWGWNDYGQATVPADLTDVVAISAGGNHSLALKSDGTVVAWGGNDWGQATVPADLSDVVAIAAGGNHSLALKSDGAIIGWGSNGNGEATAPAGLSDVVAISAGTGFSLALKSDGTVVGWGTEEWGQATVPAGLTGVVAIATGAVHSLALKADGTVVAWGYNEYGQATPPADLSNVKAIAGGYYHSLALQCASAPPPNTAPVIAADNASVLVDEGQTAANSGTFSDPDGDAVTLIASAGTVSDSGNGTWTWSMPTTDNNPDRSTVTITADDGKGGISQASFSVTVNNVMPAGCTVVGWGGNGNGQATPPAGLTDVVAISAGATHSLALKRDGTVVGWGNTWDYGAETPPAGLTDVVAIAAGQYHSLALKSDGTVVGWGSDGWGQATPPAGLANVVAIAAGNYHSLALKSDGTVVGWGDNSAGQAPPAGLTGVVAIAAGQYHNLALKSDGTVVGWGNQYGTGAETPPTGLNDVKAIAAGGGHSLALKSDGTVVGWGYSWDYGAETPPAGLTDVVAISAGAIHSLALKADGTVVGWGSNNYGEATAPAGLTDVVAISAGQNHSLALQCASAPPNQPPVIAAGPFGADVAEGQTAEMKGTFSDPDGDTVTLSASAGTVVDNGDGTWTWSMPTTDDNPFHSTVTITADDGKGGISQASFILTIFNVDPVVEAGDDQTVYRNDPVTVSGTWRDPAGALDNPYMWGWDLNGDGAIDEPDPTGFAGYGETIARTTSFADAGVYTLAFAVVDASDSENPTNGGYDTVQITVVNRAPAAKEQALTTNAGTDLPITLSAYDADNDTLVYSVVDMPKHGTLSGTAPNLVYTPAAGYAGPDVFTFKVNDGLADSNLATVSITVKAVNVYTWSGFFQPVDNLPTLNKVKAGQAIPVKFSLGADYGLGILAANSPSSIRITCPGGVPVDAIEETVTATNSGLSYDAAANQYIYVWKSDKAWAGTCRQFNLVLADGTSKAAGFSFTK